MLAHGGKKRTKSVDSKRSRQCWELDLVRLRVSFGTVALDELLAASGCTCLRALLLLNVTSPELGLRDVQRPRLLEM